MNRTSEVIVDDGVCLFADSRQWWAAANVVLVDDVWRKEANVLLVDDNVWRQIPGPGVVGRLDSLLHQTSANVRCVHILTKMPPQRLLLRRDAVLRLGFQPVICPPPCPAIASRRSDVLTIGFHRRGGSVTGHSLVHRIRMRWDYRLLEVPDCDHLLVGVRQDIWDEDWNGKRPES